MAEENDQNAVQPQNDEQQTVPMPPVDAEQTQTYAGEPYAAESATEPIDVQGGIEDQPTAAMPVANDGASAESAAAAGDTPDYASAAGERTVVGGSAQDARPSSTVRHRNMVRTVPCRRSRLMAPQPRTVLRMVRRTCPAAAIWRVRAGSAAAAAASQSFLRESVCGWKSAERSAERAIE